MPHAITQEDFLFFQLFLTYHAFLIFLIWNLQLLWTKKEECRSQGSITRTDRVGLLATHITEEYGWGGSACPWVLRVPPGQRINITLFNFARSGESDLLTSDPSVCYELATIHEKDHPSKTILTCGTDKRQKNVYASETNRVEIRFVDRISLKNLGKFLVQHEGDYLLIKL